MVESQKILAFDIGIRNLAWCLMESGSKPNILGWQNYDLLTGSGAEVPKEKALCSKCSVGAAFTNPTETNPTCLRHCPPSYPPLKDISGGVVYRRLPPLNSQNSRPHSKIRHKSKTSYGAHTHQLNPFRENQT